MKPDKPKWNTREKYCTKLSKDSPPKANNFDLFPLGSLQKMAKHQQEMEVPKTDKPSQELEK